ncbi:MAG: UxaA family hydrolase [Flavonifractor plautii]
MSAPLYIKVKDADNVAIAVHDIPRGTEIMPGVVTREDIPQAHKIALTDIPKGGEVVRYGVVLGYAKAPIPVGAWINEHMLDLPQSPAWTTCPTGPASSQWKSRPIRPAEPGWATATKPAPPAPATCWALSPPSSAPPVWSTWRWSASSGSCCPSTPMWTAWWQ